MSVEQKQHAPIAPFQRALDDLRRDEPGSPSLALVAQLVSLLELTAALASGPEREETLSAALAIVSRQLEAPRAALFVRGEEEGTFALRASRNLPRDAPRTLCHGRPLDELTTLAEGDEAHDRHGLVLLCPIQRRDRPLALLGLGPREAGQAYGEAERAFLRAVVVSAAAPLAKGVIQGDLGRLSQSRTRDVVQLHDLLDIGRELTLSADEASVHERLATSVMGHFVVSRCALYRLGPERLSLAHARGLRDGSAATPAEDVRATLDTLAGPQPVAKLARGPLRACLEKARLVLAVPLATPERTLGLLAIGERASGLPFTADDQLFAQALARQAVTALENVRLRTIREEKLRQDRELQLAREIQRSLFPPRAPEIPGFELAALSRPCFEVGGDLYDWIPLEDGRLAVVVADVSGKGTPASLLMASVHASVHALAGTAPPGQVVARLNRFLFASTQPSRFVTLFYAELDPASRRLSYVNAGHIPPCRLSSDGVLVRLGEGGPAAGLLAETQADYATGEVTLQPGDVVVMVTDGITEATSSDDCEFGDERVFAALRTLSGGDASAAVLEGLVSAVDAWRGDASPSDDLTALVLKVQPCSPSRAVPRPRRTTSAARQPSAPARRRGDDRRGRAPTRRGSSARRGPGRRGTPGGR